MIRQTATGTEQFCASCLFSGEPIEDCWLPLTEQFFPRKYRGTTRVTHFEHRCKTCKEVRRQQRRDQQQECRA